MAPPVVKGGSADERIKGRFADPGTRTYVYEVLVVQEVGGQEVERYFRPTQAEGALSADWLGTGSVLVKEYGPAGEADHRGQTILHSVIAMSDGLMMTGWPFARPRP